MHVAAGSGGTGFLAQKLDERRQPPLAAHDHQLGQQ